MSRARRVSAPGKLMVSGEYAVLGGAVAVVAAVTARVYARSWPAASDGSLGRSAGLPQSSPLPPEALLGRKLAEERFGPVPADLQIDVAELRRAGQKLGLGSSAAASVAVVGAVLDTHGHDLAAPATQREVFELALAGHKAVAPEGSGADVAAAALGGFVRYRLDGGRVAEAERMAFPAGVSTRVVWTGHEARTSEFVRAVRAFAARDAAGHAALDGELKAQAQRFADAIGAGRVGEIVEAAGAYGNAMGALGRAAGVSIVTAELAQIADLARQCGGAAKPSGAGGGDVAIAFFDGEARAVDFDGACERAGLDRLDLGLGAPGVRSEAA